MVNPSWSARFLFSLLAFLALSGFAVGAVAQAKEDDSSKYYNEIAAGTESGDGQEKSAEPAAQTQEAQEAPAPSSAVEADASGGQTEEGGPSAFEVSAAGEVGADRIDFETDAEDGQASATGEEDSPAAADEDAASDLKPWNRGGERHHLTFEGSTGLFYTLEAGSDRAGTFGVGLHAAFFRYGDYLYYDDDDTYFWSGLDLRITPLEFLEIYTGFDVLSNNNTAVRPELIQSIGDFQLGLKGFFKPLKWISLGGLVGVDAKSPVGKVAITLEGLSVSLGAVSTFDFSKLNERVPLRAHLNFIYLFDRTANVIDDLERDEGGCDSDANGDGNPDYDGCLNPAERLALGINRTDQMRIGVGIDALLPYFSPIVEYLMDVPVNRQDFACPEYVEYSGDSCMAKEGFRGFRQWLALGVRILPPIDSLAIDLGADIGTAGYAPSVHEIAPQTPYRILMGLSYNFDPFPDAPQCADEPAEFARQMVESQSYIVGRVRDAAEPGKPIEGAAVSFVGGAGGSQASDAQGYFSSPLMAPGPVIVEISADGYAPGSFRVEIPRGALVEAGASPTAIELDCPMEAVAQESSLVLRVIDGEDKPVGEVSVTLNGPTEVRLATDANGRIERELEPGDYTMLIEKDGFLKRQKSLRLVAGITTNVEVQLNEKPKETNVTISKKQIVIKKKIHFATDSDEIDPKSFSLLDEIADVLFSNPEIKLVQIQGHTDNRGTREYNLELSGRRAESVRRYMVAAGVVEGRLEAKGFGPDEPISPNITSQGRATNRRVEFHIIDRE